MKTILSGRVTMADIEDADFLAGIVPTSFITNGLSNPPAASKLPVEVFPVCQMQPVETAELARDYTLCQAADALICVGENDHLVNLARKYGLPVYVV